MGGWATPSANNPVVRSSLCHLLSWSQSFHLNDTGIPPVLNPVLEVTFPHQGSGQSCHPKGIKENPALGLKELQYTIPCLSDIPLPQRFVVVLVVHRITGEQFRLPRFLDPLSLLSFSTGLLHHWHRLLLDLFEYLHALEAACRINQMEVGFVNLRVKNNGGAYVVVLAEALDRFNVRLNKSILPVPLCQPDNAVPIGGRAKKPLEAFLRLLVGGLDETFDVTGHKVDENFARVDAKQRSNLVHCKASPSRGVDENEWE